MPKENLPHEPFELAALQQSWSNYQAKVANQISKTLILKGEMQLEGNVIHLVVDNLIQQQNLHAFKEELMEFLRSELKNYSITLESTIKSQKGDGRKMYTSQEKFKHLLEKYPILEQLRSELGLEAKF